MLVRPLIALAAIGGAVLLIHVVTFGTEMPARWRESMDAAHVVGFAVLTWFLAATAVRLAPRYGFRPSHAVGGLLVFIGLLAVGSEFAQTFVARDADVGDLVRDVVGMAAGVMLLLGGRAHRLRRALWCVTAFAAMTAGLWAPGRVLAATFAARLRVPELVGFESSLDSLLYSAVNADIARVPAGPEWPLRGHVVTVRPLSGNAGIAFDRLPRAWGGYSSLSFLIATIDSSTGHATIRVHDSRHNNQYDDRFNRGFEIGPVPTRVRFSLGDIRNGPRSRLLDLSRIETLILFVSSDESAGFVVDDIRLD